MGQASKGTRKQRFQPGDAPGQTSTFSRAPRGACVADNRARRTSKIVERNVKLANCGHASSDQQTHTRANPLTLAGYGDEEFKRARGKGEFNHCSGVARKPQNVRLATLDQVRHSRMNPLTHEGYDDEGKRGRSNEPNFRYAFPEQRPRSSSPQREARANPLTQVGYVDEEQKGRAKGEFNNRISHSSENVPSFPRMSVGDAQQRHARTNPLTLAGYSDYDCKRNRHSRQPSPDQLRHNRSNPLTHECYVTKFSNGRSQSEFSHHISDFTEKELRRHYFRYELHQRSQSASPCRDLSTNPLAFAGCGGDPRSRSASPTRIINVRNNSQEMGPLINHVEADSRQVRNQRLERQKNDMKFAKACIDFEAAAADNQRAAAQIKAKLMLQPMQRLLSPEKQNVVDS